MFCYEVNAWGGLWYIGCAILQPIKCGNGKIDFDETLNYQSSPKKYVHGHDDTIILKKKRKKDKTKWGYNN